MNIFSIVFCVPLSLLLPLVVVGCLKFEVAVALVVVLLVVEIGAVVVEFLLIVVVVAVAAAVAAVSVVPMEVPMDVAMDVVDDDMDIDDDDIVVINVSCFMTLLSLKTSKIDGSSMNPRNKTMQLLVGRYRT